MAKKAIAHEPFIPAARNIRELTPVPVLLGIVLGILFGASSLYLALKVGMTVSASIPIAVLSITLFRGFSKAFGLRKATILENNIVQTTGSAGESIAFGVAVTMPALLILGYDMDLGRITLVALLGGALGCLMMIPLRRALIVKGHGELPYPEGTACAEVLIVGEKGGTTARTVFTGFFIGLIYKFLNVGTRLWTDVTEKALTWFKGAAVSAEVSPELLGVGYIIGPRNSCIMVAGGILSSFVLIPMVKLFGDGLTTPLFPATKLISEMSVHDVWRNYILYIGAGAVAAGGLISMIESMPTIVRSARAGFKGLKGAKGEEAAVERTDRDLSMTFVLVGTIVLLIAIWLAPALHVNLLGAALILAFGFLFVTVSSRITGEIGSSSNPISGMTVATLLITSLIFLGLGWVSPADRVTALSIAAIVCIAASNAGTTSQDLKTGFLVGATPRSQQIGFILGAVTSALVIAYTLNALNQASTIYSKNVPAGARIENPTELTEREMIRGPGAAADTTLYRVLQLRETPIAGSLSTLQPGKYLVDDNGNVKYLVDPGINGVLKARDDGTVVPKYEAPKARLMSLIIDGILNQKLPWGLVLLGISIAILLQISGVSPLPFAVGVYLPLATSMPIFIGGMIRWLTDRLTRRKGGSEAESDSSPGVLYASGLIAGGSIGGIALAIFSLQENWSSAINLGAKVPAISGSQWTAVIAFTVLVISLYRTGLKKPKT